MARTILMKTPSTSTCRVLPTHGARFTGYRASGRYPLRLVVLFFVILVPDVIVVVLEIEKSHCGYHERHRAEVCVCFEQLAVVRTYSGQNGADNARLF